ncbi:uncharacterized protein [Aegilops tauschii subsp. strangulata]|uniref:uncharacterized protein isoform X2 n=1 Tax=Aegilops tauschii subsp. strangulata TaxID=200361 RepID=UPI001ABCC74E|nr:uncharacterized protein LOC109732845 isoform X2 [Aegilops tauschii subsp. strangulata]
MDLAQLPPIFLPAAAGRGDHQEDTQLPHPELPEPDVAAAVSSPQHHHAWVPKMPDSNGNGMHHKKDDGLFTYSGPVLPDAWSWPCARRTRLGRFLREPYPVDLGAAVSTSTRSAGGHQGRGLDLAALYQGRSELAQMAVAVLHQLFCGSCNQGSSSQDSALPLLLLLLPTVAAVADWSMHGTMGASSSSSIPSYCTTAGVHTASRPLIVVAGEVRIKV